MRLPIANIISVILFLIVVGAGMHRCSNPFEIKDKDWIRSGINFSDDNRRYVLSFEVAPAHPFLAEFRYKFNLYRNGTGFAAKELLMQYGGKPDAIIYLLPKTKESASMLRFSHKTGSHQANEFVNLDTGEYITFSSQSEYDKAKQTSAWGKVVPKCIGYIGNDLECHPVEY
jgi:hypothetical protein